jgi:DNA-binding NtrC family response regulator
MQDHTVTTLRPRIDLVAPSFRLTVTRGSDSGVIFAVDGSVACPTLLGTSEVCSMRLSDAEVSRRHASVEVFGGRLRVRDLDSTNGTFVNGTRVVEALLHGGEDIYVGTSVIRVEVESEAKRVTVSEDTSFGEVLGRSVAMRKLYPICRKLTESDVPLIIEGETGTGKEALAEAIHAASPRASGPFVVFDCTAVPATLIESALFGHERGAFTGATSSQRGVFEEANRGTLLIDEVGDLDTALQAKLLRCIQKSEVRRIGGAQWQKVDVRVIAATRRDLDREVQVGRFRDDLFFRLAVARIALPPLRERREDVPLLAEHFWTLYGGQPESFPVHLLERFMSHGWPGNVRELGNTVARVAALGELAQEQRSLFSQPPPAPTDAPSDFIGHVVRLNMTLADARERVIREFERQYVGHLLDMHSGDTARAAAASGIGERYLRMIRARVRTA